MCINEEVLQNAHTKTKTEENSPHLESYGVDPQAGVKLEPMTELDTRKVDSNIEQVGGNSTQGKKIQDMQENPLRNGVQEKSTEDNESIDNQYQQQKTESSDGSGVHADEQDKGKENTVEMDITEPSYIILDTQLLLMN